MARTLKEPGVLPHPARPGGLDDLTPDRGQVREDAPENRGDVAVGEDADSPGDQGDAPEPAVLGPPQDPDAFALPQVQLVGAPGRVGVQGNKPGGTRGSR